MNTYFIKGIECKVFLGQQTWQKSVMQKLIIDIEWRSTVNKNMSLTNDDLQNIENVFNSVLELIASKQWPTLNELGEQIKTQMQLLVDIDYLQIKINIPHAHSQANSIGIIIQL